MKTFWLFRTNLRPLEYYHAYTDLKEFKLKCHDFYLLQGIWFLENDIFDEVVIWRLAPNEGQYPSEIVFEINGKKFIQRFVDNFIECTQAPDPTVSFFRGGFPEYGMLTKKYPSHFGLKLYCGTGKRVYPQHNGIYDKILVEDDRDVQPGTVPFFKTANPEIFKPLTSVEKIYDICWPCNFTQLNYKGQEFFIKKIAESDYLKSLSIVHVGNKPEIGQQLCDKYNVNNITFIGSLTRPALNEIFNQSKVALITSNALDGSPRLITELLAAGLPLLLRNDTRGLFYYRKNCIGFSDFDDNLASRAKVIIDKYADLDASDNRLSMDTICEKNLRLWGVNG